MVLEQAIELLQAGDACDLTELCGGDEPLERTVRELLAGEEELVLSLRGRDDATHPAASLEPGTVLGDYEISALLGVGGMGAVYLARERALERMVALKVIDPLVASAARFRREATIAAALDHPNIVPVFAVGEANGMSFLAMKWLTGPGLDRVEKPLPPRRVAEIGVAVARALDETHASGIVHRDIKPGNVILDDGVPYLVDFGLARSQRDLGLTARGAFLGTLEYVSPELIERGAAGVSGRSDLYSLGATLYELAAGRRCFEASDREQLVRAILSQDPERPGLSSEHSDLETILLRALDKDPERRFPTAGEFADDLERYLRGEPILSRRLGWLARGVRLARRHRVATAIAGVLALATFVAGGLLLASRVTQEARFAAAIDDAERALDRDSSAAAAAILRALHRADEPRVLSLQRRIAARDALTDLLDQVQRGSEEQDPDELRRLAERIVTLRAGDDRPLHAAVALVLTAYHVGDRATALARLDALEATVGRGRASRALRKLVETGEPAALPAELGASADEHVFAAIALRRAGAALEAVQFEIEAARSLDDGHFRAQVMEALLLFDAGRVAEALAAFRVLPRPGRNNDDVHRTRMLLELALGRQEDAERSLSRIPAERRTALDRYYEFQLLWTRGDLDAMRAAVAEAPSIEGVVDPLLLLVEGRLALVDGRFEAAIASFSRLLERTTWHQLTDEAEASLLRARYQILAASAPGTVDRSEFEALREAASDSLATARFPLARANLRWLEGRISRVLGRHEEALQAFREAVTEEPDSPTARLEFAELANTRLDGLDSPARLALAEEIRAMLRPLLERSSGARVLAPPVAVLEGWKQELCRSAKVGDWEGLAVAARAAHAFAAARLPGDVAGLESILAAYRDALSGGAFVSNERSAAARRELELLLTDS